MTVSVTAPRNDYIGTGLLDIYDYTFRIFAATDLRVTTRDTDGVETALTYPTDYTVTGVNGALGGTITLTAGNLTTDYVLTIRFDRTPQQATDLRNQGSFFAETHENKFDELTRYIQALRDVSGRSIHLPETEDPTDFNTALPPATERVGRFFAGGADGSIIMAEEVTGTPATAFGASLIDDTTAAAARATLGVPTLAEAGVQADNVFRITGSADATKQLAFEVDGLTTATTRTATAPDYNIRLGNLPAGIGPLPYAGSSIPTGWLECDGSSVLRATYADLFTAIGTTWGSVDGTHFTLPDMRNRVPIGAGTGVTVEISTASSSNGFTVTANNTKWITGMPVIWSALSGFTTSGSAGPTYYVVRVSSTNVRYASTLALAQAGTPDITISGTGSCTVTYTMTVRTLGEQGGEESHAMSSTEMMAHTHTGGISGGANGGTTSSSLQLNVATGSFGGNAAMNNMQAFIVTKYIISY